MDKKEQKEFLIHMIKNVTTEMLTKIDKIPENWTGEELRYWIRDNFDTIVWNANQDKRSSNYRNYRNDIITRGL